MGWARKVCPAALLVREGGKGFLAAIRLKGVILPAPAAIPATVAYLYGQGGGW